MQKKREIPFYALQKYISTLCRNTVLLVGDTHVAEIYFRPLHCFARKLNYRKHFFAPILQMQMLKINKV